MTTTLHQSDRVPEWSVSSWDADTPCDLSLSMTTRTTDGRMDKTIEGKFNAFGKLTQLTVTPKGLPALTTQYTYTPMLEISSVTDENGNAPTPIPNKKIR